MEAHRSIFIKKVAAMELNKNSPVVQNLLRKRDLLSRGNPAHEQIRSALVICGGGMRGVFGGGAVIAFHRLGFADCFDVVVGVSAGAAIGSYFLAGEIQTLLGTSIYYEECLNNFIRFTRWPIADIDYIERVMRNGRKQLDINAICKHRSQLFAGVTDFESGEGHFLDVKCAKPEPLAAIKASLSMVPLYRRTIMVNGRNFIDGTVAIPFPIKKVLTDFKPTDTLIIANCSQSQAVALSSPSWRNRVLMALFTIGLPPRVRALLAGSFGLWRENLEYLCNCTTNVGVLWGPSSIGRLTLDYQLLRAAAEEGVRKTLTTFGQPKLPFNLL